jgi:hypothetical protein
LPAEDADDYGKVIHGDNLFGDDELPLWIAMIVEKADLRCPTVEDIQEQVRRHWHRGILLLQTEWSNCDGAYERFFLYLAERAGLPDQGRTDDEDKESPTAGERRKGGPVTVRLGDPGTDVATGQPVSWLMNRKGSPHVALMGGTGSRKTRLAVNLVEQIRQQSGAPVILFDMAKGDLAGNRELVRMIKGRVVKSPNTAVPLDVLNIPNEQMHEITNAAMRFRESFVRVAKTKPGGVQLDALREAAQRAYMDPHPISITNIRDALRVV